jgi:hypothetical protein
MSENRLSINKKEQFDESEIKLNLLEIRLRGCSCQSGARD